MSMSMPIGGFGYDVSDRLWPPMGDMTTQYSLDFSELAGTGGPDQHQGLPGTGGPGVVALLPHVANTDGKVACALHGKFRSIECLSNDGTGRLVCNRGNECKVMASTGPDANARPDGVCAVHGKTRNPKYLCVDPYGRTICLPGFECKGAGAGVSASQATMICALHGKMRSLDSLVHDGSGRLICAPGRTCKGAGAASAVPMSSYTAYTPSPYSQYQMPGADPPSPPMALPAPGTAHSNGSAALAGAAAGLSLVGSTNAMAVSSTSASGAAGHVALRSPGAPVTCDVTSPRPHSTRSRACYLPTLP